MATAPDLSRLSAFSALKPAAIEYLQSRLVQREIPSGAVILHRFAMGDLLAIVAAGQVSLKSSDGAEQFLSAGEVFGEEMLCQGLPSPYEVRAIQHTTLWLLSRMDWLAAAGPSRRQAELASVPAQPKAIQVPDSTNKTIAPPHKQRSLLSDIGQWLLLAAACLLLGAVILGPTMVVTGGRALAMRALEGGRPREATEILHLALSLQPESASLHDASGYVYYYMGDFANAREEFEKAVGLDPGLASALHNLGSVQLAQSRPEEAIKNFEAVVELDPGNAMAYRNLGDAHLLAGHREAAASAYQRAWSLDPALLEARVRWAALILDHDREQDARKAWLEVIRQQPGHADALLGLGAVSLLEGRPAAALIHLQAARAVNPSDPLTRLYLGLSLQALDRPEQAAAEFEQVLALSREPALVDLARSRLLELYTQLVPVGAGQEGGAQAKATP